jgi:nucleoside-diphosphate-sugar epimerase
MRIFITGGAGYVGRAVVSALSAAGHEVIGLARTPDKVEVLERLGARAVAGALEDPASYVETAAGCDAVVHLAQSPGPDRAATDIAAVQSFLRAAREGGRVKSLVYTSVLFVLGDTGGVHAPESQANNPPAYAAARAQAERLVLEGGGATLACAVVRPGMVYGGGAGGSVSELFRGAVEEGAPTYVGGGENRWSLVHREDAAELFRTVLEGQSRGIFHAVDGHPLAVREVAAAAGRAAGTSGRVESLPLEQARGVLGSFADALCLDQLADASRARALGWRPKWPAFDRAAPAAFEEWTREERTSPPPARI